MKCPFCGKLKNKVIDSRLNKQKDTIRRRRKCLQCSRRFTTYEHKEDVQVVIIKKDGRREIFNRSKIKTGILKACEKTNLSTNSIEEFIDNLERELIDSGEQEIASTLIGEKIMHWLHSQDDVAYVRFASVYKEFKSIDDFIIELQKLLKKSENVKSNG
ncbi:MAG: transcriptional repressor NrdR [Desulfobacterales bacterium]|nr:transcriptional repressor NrdR [Desulfobacterales bacterium]